MKKPKVLFISPVAFFKGGAERSLFDLMSNQGVEPLLLVPAEGELAAHARGLGIRVQVLGMGRVADIRRPFRFSAVPGVLGDIWRYVRSLRSFARREGIDVIHTNGLKPHCLAMVARLGGGVPLETTLFTASGPATHTLFLHPITAPALILVGAMMAKGLGRIRWDVPQEGIPAFLIVAGIPLTFSIADGISLGVMAWSALAVATRDRETPVLLHVLAGVLALRWLSELLG